MIPAARLTDPDTSHAAGEYATARTTARDAVLRILAAHGPLHDRGIEALHQTYVERGLMPARTGQRLRTARRELADQGLVRETREDGKRLQVRLPSGCRSQVWEAADA